MAAEQPFRHWLNATSPPISFETSIYTSKPSHPSSSPSYFKTCSQCINSIQQYYIILTFSISILFAFCGLFVCYNPFRHHFISFIRSLLVDRQPRNSVSNATVMHAYEHVFIYSYILHISHSQCGWHPPPLPFKTQSMLFQSHK